MLHALFLGVTPSTALGAVDRLWAISMVVIYLAAFVISLERAFHGDMALLAAVFAGLVGASGFLVSKFTTPSTDDAGCSSRAISLLVAFLPTITALDRTLFFGARAEVRLVTSRAAVLAVRIRCAFATEVSFISTSTTPWSKRALVGSMSSQLAIVAERGAMAAVGPSQKCWPRHFGPGQTFSCRDTDAIVRDVFDEGTVFEAENTNTEWMKKEVSTRSRWIGVCNAKSMEKRVFDGL
jgi:hypothetical protein